MIFLLQITCWMQQWKNFKNRSIFGKDEQEFGVLFFFDSWCTEEIEVWEIGMR